jgi:MYXO-CTERM domain-containing protein
MERRIRGTNRLRNALISTATAALTLSLGGVAHADQTVQVPIDALLNGRTVTTLTGGVLVTWTAGVDGGGGADGYLTAAASKFHNDPAGVKALPDDGKFPATARHPEVILHFANAADAASQQTHFVKGMGDFTFAVPAATYSKMFLFFTSSEGGSALKLTLTYADATVDVVNQTVPDYFNNIADTDPVFFNLAADLAKWNKQNNIAEMNHHNLDGMEIHPTATKMLTGIKVEKSANGYLVFWGATGIATSAVTFTDAGSGGGNTDAGGSDTAAAGTGGAAGAGGGAGSGGGAGAGATGTAGTVGTGAAGATGTGAAGATGAGAAGSNGTGAAGTTGAAGATSVGAAGSTGAGGAQSAGTGGAPGARSSNSGCNCAVGGAGRSEGLTGLSLLLLIATRLRRRRIVLSRQRLELTTAATSSPARAPSGSSPTA